MSTEIERTEWVEKQMQIETLTKQKAVKETELDDGLVQRETERVEFVALKKTEIDNIQKQINTLAK